MILGLSVAAFTKLHTIISLIGIATGLVFLIALLKGRWLGGWNLWFLVFTILTSVTGFPFLLVRPTIGPPHIVGMISLVDLAIALVALYQFRRVGIWRPIYTITAVFALYLNCFVLVVQAFGAIEKTPLEPRVIRAADHKLVKELIDIDQRLNADNVTEAWHDLQQIKEQAQTMFELGLLNLDVKARVESLYWQVAERIEQIVKSMDPEEVPEDLKNLKIELADQHICNFSVFQSLLDHWALGQLFPIVPIHRLNERPQLESTLVDITCDSDGKVSKYIDLQDVRETLPLHDLRGDQPYYLGIFLTGAYQDIMGDIHNLFGRVNEVHVFLDEDEESGFYVEEEIPGQSIGEVLAMTQYDWRDLEKRMKVQIDAAIKQDQLKPSEGMRLLQDYERGLKDQTYLSLET